MKKRLRHRVRVIGILFAFALAIGPTPFAIATAKNEARVSQAIHNVQLLAPNGGSRPASINDNVRQGTAVRTGSDSRAELAFTNRTLTRLGANSVLSFGKGEFDLANGSMLLYLPKGSGGARINTAFATAAGNSFTVMAEYRPKVVDQIHSPRRPCQHLSQTSSGRDSDASRWANDNGPRRCDEVARTAGCRSFRVD